MTISENELDWEKNNGGFKLSIVAQFRSYGKPPNLNENIT